MSACLLLVGTALAAPAPPTAEVSPLLYLDEPLVRQELAERLPALAPCFADLADTEAEFGLTLLLGRDGIGREPVLEPVDPERQDCLGDVLAGVPFSPHHEDPLTVRTILVWRTQRLVPHPMVALTQRPQPLLFLYVADPEAAADLEAALRSTRTEE